MRVWTTHTRRNNGWLFYRCPVGGDHYGSFFLVDEYHGQFIRHTVPNSNMGFFRDFPGKKSLKETGDQAGFPQTSLSIICFEETDGFVTSN
ncbi:hypothetical protein F0562_027863 [Nyssa sinensis]|uniref:Uncharacterized protein n=1 Tax=Nyssa sinensis TaxID=561372 RepID=A0A5J5B6V0_9ASTE|nr:hypothetical protein F0562_027863 [Nyssa sinensis]